jgi:hypothetical protein
MLRSLMTHLVAVIAFVALNSIVAWTAEVTGAVTGRLVSYSIDTPSGGQANVWTTPSTGEFILTQHCGFSVNLFGSTFGRISGNYFDATGCKTFSPGIVLPANETLTCVMDNNYSDGFCLITGIIQ